MYSALATAVSWLSMKLMKTSASSLFSQQEGMHMASMK